MTAIADYVLDAALAKLDTEANRLDICSQEPASYVEATSTYTLGNKTSLSVASPSDRTPDGRKVAIDLITGGTVTGTGTATHWAITDTVNSRLLATGALTPLAVTSGNDFTLESFNVAFAIFGNTPSIDGNTDLTAFAQWQADMLSFGETYGSYMDANKNSSYPGELDEFGNPTYAFDELLNRVYYDADRVFQNIYDYTGDSKWLTYASAARTIYDIYLVHYDYAAQGYRKFTEGPRRAWQRNNGDTQAAAMVNGLANLGAYSPDSVPLASTASEAFSREVAYNMMSYMDQELIGEPHRNRLEDMLEQVLGTGGHIEQWFVTGPPANFAPFMFALTCEALIRYYNEQSQDSRIIPAIVLGADWIWDNAWSTEYEKFPERLNEPFWEYGSELSLLICPLYWWLYLQNGDSRHKTRGDTIFNTGMPSAYMGPYKQWNQVYRWTPAGLLWRDQAKGIWG